MTVGNQLAGAPLAGILTENSTDFIISGNNVTSTTSSYPIMGTWIKNSGSDPNRVEDNIYDNLYYGNYASNKNRHSSGAGLVYLCNQNSDNRYDFYVTNHSGTSNEGIALNQGSTYVPAGNVFTKAGSPVGSDFNNQSNLSSNYYYNPTISSHQPTNTINITTISTNNSDICYYEMMASGSTPEDESQLEEVMNEYQYHKQKEAEFLESYNKNPSNDLPAEAERYKMLSHRNIQQILLYHLQSESVNWTQVQSWLEKKQSLYSHYQIADLLVQNNKSSEALTYLEKASTFVDDEEDSKDLAVYIELKKLLHQWRTTGKSLATLGKKEVLQLQELADKYQGRGSAQAQNILNFWYGYTYVPKYEGETGKAKEKSLPISSSTAPATLDYRIAPNPAKDLLTISYTLEAAERAGA